MFPDCSVQFDTSVGDPLPKYSVVDLQSNNYQFLYPNPASGTITIETEPQSMIEIIDLQGKILQKEITQEERTELDVSSLLKGMYLVRAIHKSGKIETGKFIKE